MNLPDRRVIDCWWVRRLPVDSMFTHPTSRMWSICCMVDAVLVEEARPVCWRSCRSLLLVCNHWISWSSWSWVFESSMSRMCPFDAWGETFLSLTKEFLFSAEYTPDWLCMYRSNRCILELQWWWKNGIVFPTTILWPFHLPMPVGSVTAKKPKDTGTTRLSRRHSCG